MLHDILTPSQVNILVDSNGTARLAGLGSAFIPSRNHATWSAMDAELLSYGTAPELVRPNPPSSSVLTSKESDIYAFAVLAWEVCRFPPMFFQTFTKPYRSTGFCRASSFFKRTSVCGDLPTCKRRSTTSARLSRTFRPSLELDSNLLARRPIPSYPYQGRCCCPRSGALEKPF